MIPLSHLLVLSQRPFLDGQIGAAFESAARVNISRRLARAFAFAAATRE